MELFIRQESSSDFNEVRRLVTAAFGQEDEARLVDALRKDPCFIPELSLVGVVHEIVVGHILFTKIRIVGERGISESLALAPMAVDPAYQRKGIGSKLIKEGHKRALSLGYLSIIVLGHEEYYPRFGYKTASLWSIKCPFPAPENVFMAKELIPGSLKQVSGTVEYSAPFSIV